MNGVIEALHIFDELNNVILSHTFTGRPLSAAHLLPLYLEQLPPRPNLLYLSSTNPPTLVFSVRHSNLLFLATSSTEIEPLLVLEFVHRVIDAFEEFLGAPLIAAKIENNYDVVAQLLTEMCDAGTISTTEPNALRDLVEVEGFMGKLLGSINLPGKPSFSTNFSNSSGSSLIASTTPALPWRRANVRHTSNEMYADVVESLNVTMAPSGRPLAAFANGTIAFTSKVSGVPDVTLTLSGPSGKHNIGSIMELPVFHPCVRLSRWKERPGELSFIPPDGRFILAGYEVDLLPYTGSLTSGHLKLPLSLELKSGLGDTGSDFHVRVTVNDTFRIAASLPGQLGRGGAVGARVLGGPHPGTQAAPSLEDVAIRVPLPATVKNVPDIRPSHGDASYSPVNRVVDWVIPTSKLRDGRDSFSLRCTVVGHPTDDAEGADDGDPSGFGFGNDYGYDEPYQAGSTSTPKKGADKAGNSGAKPDEERAKQNKILMPSSAMVSFTVKGWLASGLKVDSIMLDPHKSRGLGEGVKPYKGVKYVTVSNGGIETRC